MLTRVFVIGASWNGLKALCTRAESLLPDFPEGGGLKVLERAPGAVVSGRN